MPDTPGAPLANPKADRVRALLAKGDLVMMPCCYDGISASLIEQAGFDLTFLSGFAVSVSRIGAPDVGLMSYGEVRDQARNVLEAISIPMMVDGDTGYGNPMNVERTVEGFARAGCAGVMIEDQVAPKRCGHTAGKAVVDREEAYDRIRAAVTAKGRTDILIKARTDARRDHGLPEAIARAQIFAELGADIVFVEEPLSIEEMRTICTEVKAPVVANMLEGGQTPLLPPAQLADLGFAIAAYPLTCLSAAMRAMTAALQDLKQGQDPADRLMTFDDLKKAVGFDQYYEAEARYVQARGASDQPG
ncbi:MAG: isocitrate lyase/PEP mutase family protein [Pseudomonadota bacterium]